jgi:hypothetical protein
LSAEEQLASFLAKFTPEIAALAEAILAKMRRRYPSALELVYDNYNALAIGYAPGERTSDAIFSIAVFPRNISLFFLQGAGIADPDRLFKGTGKVARHVPLPRLDSLDDPRLLELMARAVEQARVPFPAKGQYRLIIKSISAKQRPRRPN